jgi:hypothetical protein
MRDRSLFQSQRGSILIQVLIASGLALVVVLIIGQMTLMMQKFVTQAQVKLTLFEIRNNLLSTIVSDTAWKNTTQHPDNKTNPNQTLCLTGTNGDTPPPVDCSGISVPLTLVDGSNAVVLSKTNLTAGYTRLGAVCNAFDATNGNSACPIRVQAQWATECVSPCNMRAPPLKISISFQYNDPNAPFPINTDNLNFVLRR